MPTLQTAPLYKWTFPEQAIRRNKKGYGWAGAGTTRPRPDIMSGEESPFAAHERQVALDRLANNHQKMLGMMGARDTTERSQRYKNDASQSQSHINGKFREPAYEFSATAGGLRGGTQYFFYSQEGQNWIDNWKQRRINELNSIQKGVFSSGAPQRIQVAPAYNDLDAILAKVLDQFEAGAFSSSLTDDMNKLQGAFLKMGSVITPSKLAQYMRVVGDIRRQTIKMTSPDAIAQQVAQLDAGDDAAELAEEAVTPQRGRAPTLPATYRAGDFKLDTKDVKLIKTVGLIADRLVRLLGEINKFVNDTPQERERAMEEIGSRVLGAISGKQAAFGQRVPVSAPPTRGSIAQREGRETEQRPPAELETMAGRPPVKPF